MSSAREMGQGQGTLSAAAALVSGARHDFERLDRELVEHLAAAKAVWGGGGSSAFQALGLAWSERQRTIVGALDRFEEGLRATERDNVGTDETQSAAFALTHHRLG
ncbi:MAG TPA: hypothetical protein VGK78_11445 [Nocardioides sp.]|uniref:hypothetical protein n=1 Tax=Nocardioides sp. TaxID=35761 RepID=UPI002F40FC9A